MNTHDITLPDLTDERIDAIEASLFERIAVERSDALEHAERARARAARRGRIWMGAAAAAAFVAVAAIIAPQLTGVNGADTAFSAAEQPVGIMDDGSEEAPFVTETGDALTSVAGTAATTTDREIIATANATVRVDSARSAADEIAADAAAAGGYVESMSIGDDLFNSTPYDEITPDQALENTSGSRAWITVRIPQDQLTTALAGLADVGEVVESRIDRTDVTTDVVDTRARVAALEASVARLSELMAQSTSTSDLIAAESALAERQSELDSLRQQLTWLESQVEMSTLAVSLVEPAPTVTADPAGFGDGLAGGWNGLVAALNGLVIAFGFLLPWAAVAVVVGLVIWGARRLVRRRRTAADPGPES